LKRVLREKTKGSPLYAVQLTIHLADKLSVSESDENKSIVVDLSPASSSSSSSLSSRSSSSSSSLSFSSSVPPVLSRILIGQLDRLSPKVQHMLKISSVFGNEFNSLDLARCLEEEKAEEEETKKEKEKRNRDFLYGANVVNLLDETACDFVHSVWRSWLKKTKNP